MRRLIKSGVRSIREAHASRVSESPCLPSAHISCSGTLTATFEHYYYRSALLLHLYYIILFYVYPIILLHTYYYTFCPNQFLNRVFNFTRFQLKLRRLHILTEIIFFKNPL